MQERFTYGHIISEGLRAVCNSILLRGKGKDSGKLLYSKRLYKKRLHGLCDEDVQACM